jgi:hypothetical protein
MRASRGMGAIDPKKLKRPGKPVPLRRGGRAKGKK